MADEMMQGPQCRVVSVPIREAKIGVLFLHGDGYQLTHSTGRSLSPHTRPLEEWLEPGAI